MRGWGRQQWMVALLMVLLVYLSWSRLIAPALDGERGQFGASAGRHFERRDIVELRADLLSPQAGVYKRSRNVFQYYNPQQPEPEPQPAQPEPGPEAQQAAARAHAAPKPPAFTMKYLGSFGPRERPIAVFVEGEDLYNVQEGDVVADEFVLVRVGFESADIGYVNFPGVEPKRVAIAGT